MEYNASGGMGEVAAALLRILASKDCADLMLIRASETEAVSTIQGN